MALQSIAAMVVALYTRESQFAIRIDSIRFDSLCESIRIDSFCKKKSAFRFTSCYAVFALNK